MVARKSAYLAAAVVCAVGGLFNGAARGTDIFGVQAAAVDQPQINAIVVIPGNVDPQTATVSTFSFDDFTDSTGTVFNITAYFDTGASGILFSAPTQSQMGITLTS